MYVLYFLHGAVHSSVHLFCAFWVSVSVCAVFNYYLFGFTCVRCVIIGYSKFQRKIYFDFWQWCWILVFGFGSFSVFFLTWFWFYCWIKLLGSARFSFRIYIRIWFLTHDFWTNIIGNIVFVNVKMLWDLCRCNCWQIL